MNFAWSSWILKDKNQMINLTPHSIWKNIYDFRSSEFLEIVEVLVTPQIKRYFA